MTAPFASGRARALSVVAALCLLFSSLPAHTQSAGIQLNRPDFDRMAHQQAETDKAWRTASDGRMRLEKITYRSRAGNLEIPAFVFQAAEIARPQKPSGARLGPRRHPRPPVRALHSLHPRSHGQGLHRHRAGIPRRDRIRAGALQRDRLRRRRGRRRGDGCRRAQDQIPRRRSVADRHHRLEPRRADRAPVGVPQPDDVQGGGGDGPGDQPVSASRMEGDRQAAADDRSAESFRRLAVRKA